MDKNDAALLTQRLKKQDLIAYLSNLAGSIVGVMGVVGFFMNILEEKYEIYQRKRIIRISLQYLERNRRQLADKNFLTLEIDNTPILITK
jgi:hypothetical protein